jgi:hypothetical protein
MQLGHAARTSRLDMLDVCTSWPRCMSVLHVQAACPRCMFLLYVLAAGPCYMSMLHDRPCLCCMSALHVRVCGKFRTRGSICTPGGGLFEVQLSYILLSLNKPTTGLYRCNGDTEQSESNCHRLVQASDTYGPCHIYILSVMMRNYAFFIVEILPTKFSFLERDFVVFFIPNFSIFIKYEKFMWLLYFTKKYDLVKCKSKVYIECRRCS